MFVIGKTRPYRKTSLMMQSTVGRSFRSSIVGNFSCFVSTSISLCAVWATSGCLTIIRTKIVMVVVVCAFSQRSEFILMIDSKDHTHCLDSGCKLMDQVSKAIVRSNNKGLTCVHRCPDQLDVILVLEVNRACCIVFI